jgi:hypothetical protein
VLAVARHGRGMETTWPDEPFTHRDLTARDIAPATLRRAVRYGEVRPILRGVFGMTEWEDCLELRARAVAKVVRPHVVVTDRTAAWLHEVDAHVYGEHDGPPVVETCALRGHAPSQLDGVDGRTRDLLPEDVMTIHGVRVTTPLRTALDLGCCLRRREAFAALVAFARGHHLTVADYRRALGRYRRRRGVVQLRELVGMVDPRLESPREAWTLLAILDAGLPAPDLQVWIEVDGVPTYRLDLAYRRLRVCVEYDGEEAHTGREAYDEERRRWLREHGWTVIVLRHGDFSGAALDGWLGELRAALAPAYSNRRW